MAEEYIDRVVGPGVKDDIKETTALLYEFTGAVGKAAKESRKLELNIKPDQNLKDLVKNIGMAVDANGQLHDITQKRNVLAEKETQVLKLQSEARLNNARAAREELKYAQELLNNAQKEEEQLKRNIGAYARLTKEKNEAARKAKDLAAEYGVESKAAQEAAARALTLNQRLIAIDASIGVHTRNVGNYVSHWNGMQNAVNQLTREFPAFFNSIQTGFMAISNNLPIIADEFQRLKKANVELQAQGKPTVSVIQQIGTAFLSWQTALSVAISLLVAYGPKIWDWLTGVSDATKEAAKRNKEYAESLKDIERDSAASAQKEIARMNVLVQTATNTAKSYETRLKAAQALQKNWPAYYSMLSSEEIMQNKLGSAVRNTTEAILKQAIATASYEKIGGAAKLMSDADIASKAATKSFDDYVDNFDKGTGQIRQKVNRLMDNIWWLQANPTAPFSKARAGWFEETKRLRKELTDAGLDVSKLINLHDESSRAMKVYQDASANAKQVTRDYQKASDEAAAGLLGSDTPEGSVKALREQISNLKEQRELLKDSVEGKKREAEINKELIRLEDQLDKRTQSGKYNPNKTGPRVTDYTNEQLKAEKDLNESRAGLLNARLKREAEAQHAIFDDEKQSLDKRLAAYLRYEALIEKEVQNSAAAELRIVDSKLAKIAEIEKKPTDKRTKEEKELLLSKEAYKVQRLLIEETLQADLAEIERRGGETQKKIVQSNAQETFNTLQLQMETAAANAKVSYNERLIALNDQLKKEGLTEKQYRKERDKIEKEANLAIYEARKKVIEDFLQALEKEGTVSIEVIQKFKNELANLEPPAQAGKKKGNFILKLLGVDPDDPGADGLMVYIDKAFKEIYSSIGSFIDSMYDKAIKKSEERIEQIRKERDEQMEKSNATTAFELARINATYSTEEERIAAINKFEAEKKLEQQKIDADAHAKEVAQQLEMKRIKRQQAQTAKAFAALEITANTSAAVMRAYKDLGPALGTIAAIAIGATGLAQLLKVMNQPIPEYKDGTPIGGHPADGPAVIGDGNEPELVETPGHPSYWSKPTATQVWLKKGTIVTPKSKIIAAQQGMSTSNFDSYNYSHSAANIGALGDKLDRLNDTVANKKEHHQYFEPGFIRNVVEEGNYRTEYLNMHIN